MWLQGYVRELAICLATGGEGVRWDVGSPTGQRMTALHNELCQLCACRAAADLEAHKAFVASPLLPALDSPTPAGRPDPDWLKLGVSLTCQSSRILRLCIRSKYWHSLSGSGVVAVLLALPLFLGVPGFPWGCTDLDMALG